MCVAPWIVWIGVGGTSAIVVKLNA